MRLVVQTLPNTGSPPHPVAVDLFALGVVDSMCHPVPSVMVTDQSQQLILFLAPFMTHQQYLFANRNVTR